MVKITAVKVIVRRALLRMEETNCELSHFKARRSMLPRERPPGNMSVSSNSSISSRSSSVNGQSSMSVATSSGGTIVSSKSALMNPIAFRSLSIIMS